MGRTAVLAVLLLAAAEARPARYDQRQDGDWNLHAHLENIVIVYVSKGPGLGAGLLELAAKAKVADKPGAVRVELQSERGSHEGKSSEENDSSEKSSEENMPIIKYSEEKNSNEKSSGEISKEKSSEEENSNEKSSENMPIIRYSEEKNSNEKTSENMPTVKSSEAENSNEKSSKEISEEKSSTENNSSEKTPEEKTPGGKSPEENNPGKKSPEEKDPQAKSPEVLVPEAKEDAEKKPKGARVLARPGDKAVGKQKHVFADDVEPCVQESNEGPCWPVNRAARERMESQRRQRLIDVLSTGMSPAYQRPAPVQQTAPRDLARRKH